MYIWCTWDIHSIALWNQIIRYDAMTFLRVHVLIPSLEHNDRIDRPLAYPSPITPSPFPHLARRRVFSKVKTRAAQDWNLCAGDKGGREQSLLLTPWPGPSPGKWELLLYSHICWPGNFPQNCHHLSLLVLLVIMKISQLLLPPQPSVSSGKVNTYPYQTNWDIVLSS